MPSNEAQDTKLVSTSQPAGQSRSGSRRKPRKAPHGNTRITPKHRKRVMRLFDSGKFRHFSQIAKAMGEGKDAVKISAAYVSRIIAEETAKIGRAQ